MANSSILNIILNNEYYYQVAINIFQRFTNENFKNKFF